MRELGYDDFGNVVSVKEYSVAAGSSEARETTFDFDAQGQFPVAVTIEGVDLTTELEFDPLLGLRTAGAESYQFFDAFERPVGSDSPLAGSRRSREKTEYLANGRVYRHSLPYVAGETPHWITMTYDALGRTPTS